MKRSRISNVERVVLVVLVSGSGWGCAKGPRNDRRFACLDGWVERPTAVPSMSSGGRPSILWHSELGAGAVPFVPGVALSGDHVVASSGASWSALDRATGAIVFSRSTSPANYSLGAPVVGQDGRIYVQSDVRLYAYSGAGDVLWTHDLDRAVSAEPELGHFAPTLVGEQLVLPLSFNVARAVGWNGEAIWVAEKDQPVPAFAVGHWALGYDGSTSFVTDLRTAHQSGALRDASGRGMVFLTVLGGRGIVTAVEEADGLRFVLIDTCGNPQWSTKLDGRGWSAPAAHAVVGPGENIYVQLLRVDEKGSLIRPSSIVAIDPSGKVVGGPTARKEAPWLVGADGILYAAEFRSGRASSTITALTPGLVEKWSVEVPGDLPQDASAALAGDGVLYMQVASASGSSVVALKTGSPGLARSSWPALRHDNRATNWAGGAF
jgi:outer membrane protein assembly factor BamB